jgi:DNA-binding CsgD family transcriptional regulator
MLVYFEILGGILSLIFLSVLIFSSMNYVSNILNLKSHDKEKFYKLYSIIIPIFFIGSLTFVLLKMPANNLSNMSHIIQYQIYPVTCLIIGIVGIVSYNMRKNIENTEVKNEITFISKIYIFTIPFALIDIFLLKDTQVRLSFFSLLPFFIHIYLHLSKYYFLNYENNPSKNKLEINMKSLNFTAREQKIALLIVQGNTYNQIADSLFISINTVKTHVKNIYKKANVSNKIQLTYKLQEDNSCSSNILLSD